MRDPRNVILFVHGSDEWYGSDYVLFEIVCALEGTEFTPVVLVPDDVPSELAPELRLSARLRARGVEVHVLPLAVLRRRYMTPAGAVALVRRAWSTTRAPARVIAGDVVLVHSHTSAVLSGARIAQRLGVPHLWHVSEIVERPRVVGHLLARHVARSSQRIAAVSGAVRDHLLTAAPSAAAKVRVIHNGIDPYRFTGAGDEALRARLSPDGYPVVGMIGRVGTWKGQELFLAAAREVVAVIPRIRFVLVGGVLDQRLDDLDALRRLAEQYGIGDRVVVDGFAADTAAYLESMSVFVLPSLRPDPLPTTVLEAMATGKPVVAVAHGGATEMVVDGETGLLTPPGDARALAVAIIRLLENTEERERMGAAGRERARREFSPEAFSAAYLQAYRALASRPQGSESPPHPDR